MKPLDLDCPDTDTVVWLEEEADGVLLCMEDDTPACKALLDEEDIQRLVAWLTLWLDERA